MHGFRQKNDKIDLRLPKREAQTSYVIDFTGNNFLALKPRRSQEKMSKMLRSVFC